jgi:hypothetical protein
MRGGGKEIEMMTRRLITTLLIVVLALSGATRARASSRDDERNKITPEEEREARELLEDFNQKFVGTNDIAPLIKDYFVPDFSSRLRQNAETFPFTIIDWKDEATPPDSEDLRRFYVATTNLLHDLFPLYAAAAKKCAEEEDKEDGEEGNAKGDGECDDSYDPKLEKILPPVAVEIVKTDPLLREMWFESDEADTASNGTGALATPQAGGSAQGECADNCAASGGHEDRMVKNATELRHITKVFAELGKVLREHLAAHPVSFEKEVAEEDEDEDKESKEAEFRRFDPKRVSVSRQARVLSKEFYGYPEGTRLICADVGGLHAELVRADGKLRILTVYLLMED